MKILFQCRSNLYELSGGDRIQIEQTKKFLELQGVEVVISTTDSPDFTNVDILHLFNPSLLALNPVLQAKQKGIPVAISTIHWDMKEYYQSMFKTNRLFLSLHPRGFITQYINNQVRAAAYNWWWYKKNKKNIAKLFSLADLLLPNSLAEADLIKTHFPSLQGDIQIIPNGVSVNDQNFSPEIFYKKYGLSDFILCAGRIEYRKNQHLLLQALSKTSMPLVFIGNDTLNRGYTSLCKKLAKKRGNVYFITHMPQEELYSAYLHARVHALISWYETPGLANLEAAYFGCNLAISDKGCTREYFSDFAEYCNPNDLGSIQKAVLTAFKAKKNFKLKEYILKHFTWEKAARATHDAYDSLL